MCGANHSFSLATTHLSDLNAGNLYRMVTAARPIAGVYRTDSNRCHGNKPEIMRICGLDEFQCGWHQNRINIHLKLLILRLIRLWLAFCWRNCHAVLVSFEHSANGWCEPGPFCVANGYFFKNTLTVWQINKQLERLQKSERLFSWHKLCFAYKQRVCLRSDMNLWKNSPNYRIDPHSQTSKIAAVAWALPCLCHAVPLCEQFIRNEWSKWAATSTVLF